MYIATFGFFSFIWFGWAQENPRKGWRNYLRLAAAVTLITSLLGVYLSVRNWRILVLIKTNLLLFTWNFL